MAHPSTTLLRIYFDKDENYFPKIPNNLIFNNKRKTFRMVKVVSKETSQQTALAKKAAKELGIKMKYSKKNNNEYFCGYCFYFPLDYNYDKQLKYIAAKDRLIKAIIDTDYLHSKEKQPQQPLIFLLKKMYKFLLRNSINK